MVGVEEEVVKSRHPFDGYQRPEHLTRFSQMCLMPCRAAFTPTHSLYALRRMLSRPPAEAPVPPSRPDAKSSHSTCIQVETQQQAHSGARYVALLAQATAENAFQSNPWELHAPSAVGPGCRVATGAHTTWQRHWTAPSCTLRT